MKANVRSGISTTCCIRTATASEGEVLSCPEQNLVVKDFLKESADCAPNCARDNQIESNRNQPRPILLLRRIWLCLIFL